MTTGDRVGQAEVVQWALRAHPRGASSRRLLRRKYDVTSTEFDLPTFADLPLRAELLAAVAELGYTQPSPVQAEAIAPLVEGRDLLGQAATGTGKTAAFALPVLQELEPHRRGKAPVALVLVPTREL